MIAVLVLVGLIALRVGLLGLGSALLVRPVRDCPACFRPTAPVRVRWLHLLPRFEWRWCMDCGWRGLARVTRD